MISVIHCRFDEATTRHRLAIKRLLESLNAAVPAEEFALRAASY